MDDLTSNLMVIGVTAVVVAAIFIVSHRAKENSRQAIQEMAVRHGWTYTNITGRLSWGTRLSGKNWELVTLSEHVGQPGDAGSSNVQSSTTWTGAWTTPPDFTLIIGPRLSSNISAMYLPPEYAGLKELDPGMKGLSYGYVLLGDAGTDLDFLRVSTIPGQLTDWPEKNRPLIKITRQSLEISINGYHMEKPEEMEKLILLGDTLIAVLDR